MDTLAHEYGWTPDTLMAMPLARVFCFFAAAAERNGEPVPGPNFAERDILGDIRAASDSRKWKKKGFRVSEKRCDA